MEKIWKRVGKEENLCYDSSNSSKNANRTSKVHKQLSQSIINPNQTNNQNNNNNNQSHELSISKTKFDISQDFNISSDESGKLKTGSKKYFQEQQKGKISINIQFEKEQSIIANQNKKMGIDQQKKSMRFSNDIIHEQLNDSRQQSIRKHDKLKAAKLSTSKFQSNAFENSKNHIIDAFSEQQQQQPNNNNNISQKQSKNRLSRPTFIRLNKKMGSDSQDHTQQHLQKSFSKPHYRQKKQQQTYGEIEIVEPDYTVEMVKDISQIVLNKNSRFVQSESQQKGKGDFIVDNVVEEEDSQVLEQIHIRDIDDGENGEENFKGVNLVGLSRTEQPKKKSLLKEQADKKQEIPQKNNYFYSLRQKKSKNSSSNLAKQSYHPSVQVGKKLIEQLDQNSFSSSQGEVKVIQFDSVHSPQMQEQIKKKMRKMHGIKVTIKSGSRERESNFFQIDQNLNCSNSRSSNSLSRPKQQITTGQNHNAQTSIMGSQKQQQQRFPPIGSAHSLNKKPPTPLNNENLQLPTSNHNSPTTSERSLKPIMAKSNISSNSSGSRFSELRNQLITDNNKYPPHHDQDFVVQQEQVQKVIDLDGQDDIHESLKSLRQVDTPCNLFKKNKQPELIVKNDRKLSEYSIHHDLGSNMSSSSSPRKSGLVSGGGSNNSPQGASRDSFLGKHQMLQSGFNEAYNEGSKSMMQKKRKKINLRCKSHQHQTSQLQLNKSNNFDQKSLYQIDDHNQQIQFSNLKRLKSKKSSQQSQQCTEQPFIFKKVTQLPFQQDQLQFQKDNQQQRYQINKGISYLEQIPVQRQQLSGKSSKYLNLNDIQPIEQSKQQDQNGTVIQSEKKKIQLLRNSSELNNNSNKYKDFKRSYEHTEEEGAQNMYKVKNLQQQNIQNAQNQQQTSLQKQSIYKPTTKNPASNSYTQPQPQFSYQNFLNCLEQNHQLKTHIIQYEKQIQSKQQKFYELNLQIQKLTTDCLALKSEIQTIQHEKEQLQFQKQMLSSHTDLGKMHENMEKKNVMIKELELENQEMKHRIQLLNSQILSLRMEIKQYNKIAGKDKQKYSANGSINHSNKTQRVSQQLLLNSKPNTNYQSVTGFFNNNNNSSSQHNNTKSSRRQSQSNKILNRIPTLNEQNNFGSDLHVSSQGSNIMIPTFQNPSRQLQNPLYNEHQISINLNFPSTKRIVINSHQSLSILQEYIFDLEQKLIVNQTQNQEKVKQQAFRIQVRMKQKYSEKMNEIMLELQVVKEKYDKLKKYAKKQQYLLMKNSESEDAGLGTHSPKTTNTKQSSQQSQLAKQSGFQQMIKNVSDFQQLLNLFNQFNQNQQASTPQSSSNLPHFNNPAPQNPPYPQQYYPPSHSPIPSNMIYSYPQTHVPPSPHLYDTQQLRQKQLLLKKKQQDIQKISLDIQNQWQMIQKQKNRHMSPQPYRHHQRQRQRQNYQIPNHHHLHHNSSNPNFNFNKYSSQVQKIQQQDIQSTPRIQDSRSQRHLPLDTNRNFFRSKSPSPQTDRKFCSQYQYANNKQEFSYTNRAKSPDLHYNYREQKRRLEYQEPVYNGKNNSKFFKNANNKMFQNTKDISFISSKLNKLRSQLDQELRSIK